MVAGAGLPSFLYNHVNRSFLIGVGLFGSGRVGRTPFFSVVGHDARTRALFSMLSMRLRAS